MLGIGDVRDLVAELGYSAYCGVLPDKKPESIGVYPMNNPAVKAVGGNGSYNIKRISILVHWNKSIRETEKAAYELYNKLIAVRNSYINDCKIICINIDNEPHHVDTDQEGIFEYVIETQIYYER
ncbi:MAG: minor capsid protein [Lachnospiraceae bacterium]